MRIGDMAAAFVHTNELEATEETFSPLLIEIFCLDTCYSVRYHVRSFICRGRYEIQNGLLCRRDFLGDMGRDSGLDMARFLGCMSNNRLFI